MASLLKFLEATSIGKKEGIKKRKLEWKQRSNQADVDLLEYTQESITQKLEIKQVVQQENPKMDKTKG